MYKNLITNTLTLAGGTYIAQIITLISLPLLSRLFIPKLFGEFAIYMAILLLLSSISTLRYEFAIVQTKNKEESINVVIIIIIDLMHMTSFQYGAPALRSKGDCSLVNLCAF